MKTDWKVPCHHCNGVVRFKGSCMTRVQGGADKVFCSLKCCNDHHQMNKKRNGGVDVC